MANLQPQETPSDVATGLARAALFFSPLMVNASCQMRSWGCILAALTTNAAAGVDGDNAFTVSFGGDFFKWRPGNEWGGG